jgi:hypothetical protein
MKRNDNAQMMIVEAVLFSIMVIMALIFVNQLSPPSRISATISSDQLKILGDDALRSIDKVTIPELIAYSGSSLVKYIAKNDKENLAEYLNSLLPSQVKYNIYISDGNETIKWYDAELEEKVAIVGTISRSHYIIVIRDEEITKDYKMDGAENRFVEHPIGCVYEVILEMWYV